MSISWDGQALCLHAGSTKYSLYLTDKSPDGVLYSSQVVPQGWLDVRGYYRSWRPYRITEARSTLANLLGRIREVVALAIRPIADPERSYFSKAFYVILLTSTALTTGPVALAGELAVGYLLSKAYHTLPWPTLDQCYPLQSSAINISVGVLSWVPALVGCAALEHALQKLFGALGFALTKEQDAARLIKTPGIGLLVAVYASIGAPLIEEVLFRGALRDYFESAEPRGRWDIVKARLQEFLHGKATTSLLHGSRLKTILKTSLLFGLAHGSWGQGWTNVPIIAVTTLMGLIFAVLRELTGDLWASTALHATHNTMVTLRMLDLIPPLPFIE